MVGCIVGLCYGWKLSLVAIGVLLFSSPSLVGGLTLEQLAFLSSCAEVMSSSYVVHLVTWRISDVKSVQRVVVLKDQINKKLHEDSAQVRYTFKTLGLQADSVTGCLRGCCLYSDRRVSCS